MKSILVNIFFFLSIITFSQTGPGTPATNPPEYYGFLPDNELFTSPDVSAFQKYHFHDVNLYTGKVNVDVPIYEIKTGDISIPISITYNSSGVKIDDIASSVGTGWNLNAGGNVIRIIKDIEDNKRESGSYYESDWDVGSICYKYVTLKGYFKDFSNSTNAGCEASHGFGSWAKEDASPDLFLASAPGLNTKFHLEKNDINYFPRFIDGNGNVGNPTNINVFEDLNLLGFNNNDIKGLEALDEFIVGAEDGYIIKSPLADYEKFTLTNLNGIRYVFSDIDVSETISNYVPSGWITPSGFPSWIVQYQLSALRSYDSRISAWNLTNIKDYKNNEVTFTYEKYSKPTINVIRNRTDDALRNNVNPLTYSSINNHNICKYGHIPNFLSETVNIDETDVKNQYFYSVSPKVNRVQKIEWDGGSVEFRYDLTRQDALDEKALTQIIIKDKQGVDIKSYSFNYEYMNSKEGCSTWDCKRIILTSIDMWAKAMTGFERLHNFEYDTTYPLPKVNSLQQDYLGYYNNNGVETPDVNSDIIKSPTLYYHKNQGKYSILPFQLTSGQYTLTIPGDFSLMANHHSLSGLLKKMTYPTGGYSEFEYETHKFQLLGQEYIAGGARIKNQKINDANGGERILTYEYTENGKSSGYINNLPVYGYPWGYNTQASNNNISFITYDKTKGLIELTDNSFIGYSRVLEKEIGNGFKEYLFHSPKDYPNESDTNTGGVDNFYNQPYCMNFLHLNSSYPSVNFIDNDVRRSKIYKEKVFTQSNNMLSEKSYYYDYKLFNELILNYQTPLDFYHLNSLEPTNYTPRYSSKLRTERNLLSEIITKEYFSTGTVETKQEYVYDSSLPLVKEEVTTFSPTEILKKEYKYTNELSAHQSIISGLQQYNRWGELMESKTYKNGNLINKSNVTYSIFPLGTSSLYTPLPDIIYSGKGDLPNEKQITHEKFDEKGNLLSYLEEDGTRVRLVWGYDKQYLVAKMQNAPLNDSVFEDYVTGIMNASNNEFGNCFGASNSGCNEAKLRYNFERTRTDFPEITIIGYTYDPLIGKTSTMSPNGQIEYYRYDNYGRLQFIFDHKEKLIKRIDYNYKD